MVFYAPRQSTDMDAFDPLPLSPSVKATRLTTEQTISAKETRALALQDVQHRAEGTERGGRMRGKVGIITGVGPSTGIGVSYTPQSLFIADSQTATAKLMAREGAKHLYLLDFDDTHLKPFADSLQKQHPKTKVCVHVSKQTVYADT